MDKLNLPFTGIASFGKYPICTDLEKLDADIAVMGMPCDIAIQGKPGTRFGPRGIRSESTSFFGANGTYDPERDEMYLGAPWKIVDCGDVDIIHGDLEQSFKNCESMVRKIVQKGAIPVVMGGDHSITIPVAKALDSHENITLFHLDAHLDWANERFGQRHGNGSPCRRISEMPHFKGMAQFGVRGVGSSFRSDFEEARAYGSVIMSPKEIRKIGIPEAMRRVPESEKYFISIDVDSIDGSLAPGSGSPSFGGFNYDEMNEMLEIIAGKGEVIGFDFVEVSPPYDSNGTTCMMAARLMLDFIGFILKEKERKMKSK
jgi:agmatinase